MAQYNHIASLIRFWQEAPERAGFKPLHAAFFSALISELAEYDTRQLDLSFKRIRKMMKVTEETYYQCLHWLADQGFIQYLPGDRHNAAKFYIESPVIQDSAKPSSKPVIDELETSPSKPDTIQGSAQPSSSHVQGGVQDPRPHVGVHGRAEKDYPDREILPTNLPTAGAGGYRIPSVVSLSAEEADDLYAMCGSDEVMRELMRILVKFKGQNEGTSDYQKALKFGIRMAKEDAAGHAAKPPAYRPPSGPPETGSRIPRYEGGRCVRPIPRELLLD